MRSPCTKEGVQLREAGSPSSVTRPAEGRGWTWVFQLQTSLFAESQDIESHPGASIFSFIFIGVPGQ